MRAWSARNWLIGLCVGVSLSALGCAADGANITPSEPSVDLPDTEVLGPQARFYRLGRYVGEFDGEELVIRAVPYDEGEVGTEVGLAAEPLTLLPSASCGGGTPCSGMDLIGVESVPMTRRTITNGTPGTSGWTDPGECGGTPTTGVCQQIRVRNLFAQQAERVYLVLTSLVPTGMTTSVFVPAPASNNWTGVADFGIITPVPNGLWRIGEISRSTPVGSGVLFRWAFHGSTPPGQTFTFNFALEVVGEIVPPTQRASLASGTSDAPNSDYPDLGASEGTSVAGSSVALSGDGQYVVFSTASAAVHGSSGTHVVRRDLTTGTNVVVSTNDVGAIPTGCVATNPHVSSDGNVVVFESSGCTLTTGVGAAPGFAQVYVRNISAGTTALVSRDTGGGYADAAAVRARVSADGSTVVYQSAATDLAAGYPSGRTACTEVYHFSIGAGTTTHVSAARGSAPAAGWSTTCNAVLAAGTFPDVSGDGNDVVFASRQRLDSTDDPDTHQDIYVYDHAASGSARVVYRVSRTSAGTTMAGSAFAQLANQHPTISADGSFVAFTSDHTNVVGSTTAASRRHVYRRSSAEGADSSIERVTVTSTDVEGAGASFPTPWPALSASGRFVAFWSTFTNLPAPFAPTAAQVYVCDLGSPVSVLDRCWVASTAQLVTASPTFTPFAGTASGVGRISLGYDDDNADGYVAYQGNPTSWGNLGGSGPQTFVSPVGDPRAQLPSPSP